MASNPLKQRQGSAFAHEVNAQSGLMAAQQRLSTMGKAAARLVGQTKSREVTMIITRRGLALSTLALPLLAAVPAFAGVEEEGVAEKVETFRKAQFAADPAALAALCAEELSYSHSDGRVEDKATFVANATNGKSKWLSLEYQDVKIRVVGPAAIVRFHWPGESEAVADSKKSSTNLHILMNWQKQGADWKLLSRGSTKL
jgi:ketosteroid isomerase-like protein